MKKLITIFIVLATLTSGFVGFWYYQRNIYSKEILRLEILAPDEVDLAEGLEYIVKYKNNGNSTLEEPRLVFEYPEYSIPEENRVIRQELTLEDIYPGQERTISFKGRLLGKDGDVKTARAVLSYRPKNLKTRYEAETSHITRIKSVPINFEFDLSSKIESGKEINFRLNYFSNVDYPLSDLRIKIEYPSDFEFEESTPKALDKTEWDIGLLNKAEGGRIEIVGNILGEVGEEKKFKAELGTWQEGEFVLLKEVIRGIQIVKPALYISQQINGNPKYIASPGDLLHYEIFFKNIGEDDLKDMFLVARLEGSALDLETLKAPLGEFELGDNSIVFDWRRVFKLQLLGTQEEGKVEFWVELKKDWEMTGSKDKNPLIRNKVYLSQAREEFTTKVNSKLEIIQKGYFQDEVFGNSGPIPPKADESTTYTIIWRAKNYFNDVKNVKVKATLGQGVKPSGKIFPEGTSLTFDSQSKELVWQVGDMEAGQGILNDAPNVSFQITLTPVLSQRRQILTLIKEAEISGEDQWTETKTGTESLLIDTTLPDDQTVSEEMGRVQ
ncbi:MAG: hypothetical protein CMI54_04510 [Parcubacteria group bacterium]|nr:hypothetical protein [Parcubacteria group bacterium]|tara:strand:- start:6774 stop:8435 length:1662 start_codon:yes stop_codon:yes gene_type:complete